MKISTMLICQVTLMRITKKIKQAIVHSGEELEQEEH